MPRRVIVVGAGIFGVTAALELRRRGDEVTLLDAGPVPHPLAESTDVSKVVRMDYGADEAYSVRTVGPSRHRSSRSSGPTSREPDITGFRSPTRGW